MRKHQVPRSWWKCPWDGAGLEGMKRKWLDEVTGRVKGEVVGASRPWSCMSSDMRKYWNRGMTWTAWHFIYLYFFIYLWLHWVFVAACRLSLVSTFRCRARASHCDGFSCCGAWTVGAKASVVVARGLSCCGSQALERRLSSCGARA